jgi:hypothetical protein
MAQARGCPGGQPLFCMNALRNVRSSRVLHKTRPCRAGNTDLFTVARSRYLAHARLRLQRVISTYTLGSVRMYSVRACVRVRVCACVEAQRTKTDN